MPVPAKRFKLLDTDYNVPITDFLAESDDKPLSDPVTNTVESFNEAIQELVESSAINTTGTNDRLIITKDMINRQDTLLRSLPPIFQALDDPEKITGLFVSTITGNVDVPKLLATDTARSLYNSILEAYSTLRKYGGDVEGQFTNIIDAVGDLDNYFRQHLDDPVAVGTAYLAVLNKLHYAGYTKAFSKFLPSIPDYVAPYVAAGLVVTAANTHTPETIIDIANTPIASKIRYVAPNIISSIAQTVQLNTIWDDETILQLENALNIIEPGWVQKLRGETNETTTALQNALSYTVGVSELSETPKNLQELDVLVL